MDDLIKNDNFIIRDIRITKFNSNIIDGETNMYEIHLEYNEMRDNFKCLKLYPKNSEVELYYICELEDKMPDLKVVRKTFVLKSEKENGILKHVLIEEGFFAPLEIDLAFKKINQKVNELEYYNYPVLANGQLSINMFFLDNGNEVLIQNNGFSIEEIKTVIEFGRQL